MFQKLLIGTLKTLLVLSLLLLIFCAGFMTRLAAGPMEIPYLTASIEDALTNMRGGREVKIGSLELQWSTEAQEIVFNARDVSFLDKFGNGQGTADSAQFDFLITDLINGKFSITRAELNGGYLEVEQETAQLWRVADFPLKIPTAENPPQSLKEWKMLVNKVTPRILDFGRRLSETIELQSVTIENVQLLINVANGSSFVLDDVTIGFNNSGDSFEGNFKTAIANQGLPKFSTNWKISDNFTNANADFAFVGPNWSGFVPGLQLEPSDDSFVEMSLLLSRDEGLKSLTADTNIGSGFVGPAQNPLLEFSKLTGPMALNIAEDRLELNNIKINTEQFDGQVKGDIFSIIEGDGQIGFDVETTDLNAKFWTFYNQRKYFPKASFKGSITLQNRAAVVEAFSVDTPFFKVIGSGAIEPRRKKEKKDPPFALKLDLRIDEEVKLDDLKAYWPLVVAPNAREWVDEFVIEALASNLILFLDISPETITKGVMGEGTIDLKFTSKDVKTLFMPDMPPLRDASGAFHLRDNTMNITLSEGKFIDWDITSGSVDFPQLNPAGADMHVSMTGSGPIQSVYQALSDSELDLDTTTGLAPERFSGFANGNLYLTRPNSSDAVPEDVVYLVEGNMREAGLSNVLEQYDIKDASGEFKITNEGLWLNGFGNFESFAGAFEWHSNFLDESGSRVVARGNISPSDLAEFGMPARGWLNGNISYWATGHITPLGSSFWTTGLDLTDLEIDVPWIRWKKVKGEDGKATAEFRVEESGDSRLTTDVKTRGARLSLKSVFDDELRLKSGELTDIFIEDRIDMGAVISRKSDSTVEIIGNGKYLNLENIFAVDSIFYGAGAFEMPDLNVSITGILDTLHLRDGLFLSGVRTSMLVSDQIWRDIKLTGKPNGEGNLTFRFTDKDNQNPTVDLSSSNAGFALDSGLLLTSIEDGRLSVTGTLYDEKTNEPGKINIHIDNAKLVDMPFLTHILTLGSLRGIADTLGGEGILLSKISAPIFLLKDRMVITEGRASGHALGVTAQGWLDYEGGIRMDGVLVPSYNTNSALKAVPVIGDLIVGRSGEGVFSIGYYVRGTVDKAQVAVNPLSALTPGVLRRIFESPNDEYLEEVLNREATPAPPNPDAESNPNALD